MKTKQLYTAPQCVLLTVIETTPLCQSGGLDPLKDNSGVVQWGDDSEWIF